MNSNKNPLFSLLKSTLLTAASCLVLSSPALADDEFYGILESRPTQNVGTWVVGGHKIEVTDKTKIENDEGPMVVGSCVEVEHENWVAEELESVKASVCAKQ